MTLGIETSGTALSVALAHSDGVLISLTSRARNAHDALLARAVESLLQLGGAAPADLTAVAVSCGPGSFTGLRIGMAAAKGFSIALGIPIVTVPTHDALAWQIARRGMHAAGDMLAVVFDARRGDVYWSTYELGDGARRINGPHARPAAELGADLPAGTWLAGDGAHLPGEAYSGKFRIIKDGPDAMQADAIALLGREMLLRGETADPAACEPLYVREFHTTAQRHTV